VKDPVSGQFFRFGEAEEFIVRQFDGETCLDTIQTKVRERFGEELESPVLDAFIRDLRNGGILEDDGASAGLKTHNRMRIQGNLLFLRFKFFDPTWVFDRLQGWIGLFFTPYFLALSALTIVLAADTAIVNSGELARAVRSLFEPSAIPLYVFFTFLTIGLHEFAHGLTCRHFGGEVHEIGFLLIYFQPALYCNVSDAWLFPEKSKRLWVSFAGPYFELFLWALAMFVWRATEVGTLLNRCALMIVAISGIKTLFNFNPLIKLDGYYLLSDFLEIPNLRRKSFLAVGNLLSRIAGRRSEQESEATPRERTVSLLYGILAVGGSFAIMGSLLITVLKHASDGGGGLLLAVPLIGAIAIRFRRSYSVMFGREQNSSGDDYGSDLVGPRSAERLDERTAPDTVTDAEIDLILRGDYEIAEPQESKALIRRPKGRPPQKTKAPEKKPLEKEPQEKNPLSVSPEESTTVATNEQPIIESGKKAGRWGRRFAWTMGTVLAIGVPLQRPTELRVNGAFNVLPSASSDVRVSVEGILERMHVNEGDRVTAGDLIATLSDRGLRAGLGKADAEIREARARLRLLLAGPTKEEIAVVEAAVTAAADQVKYGQRKVERAQLMLKEGLLAQSVADDIEQQASIINGGLSAAKAHLNQVVNSVRPEQIDQIVAQIDKLRVDRQLIEQQMGSLRVFSPATGIVGTPQRQLAQMAGQFVKKGDPVAKIFDFTSVKAQITISEKEISEVKIGQPIELKVRAYPDAVFHGKVTFIATSANDPATAAGSSGSSSDSTIAKAGKSVNDVIVNTEIDNASFLLKPEMTGQAKIDCGRRRLADLFLWHLKRYLKVDSFSF
jgi:multidrug resistance efflux pump